MSGCLEQPGKERMVRRNAQRRQAHRSRINIVFYHPSPTSSRVALLFSSLHPRPQLRHSLHHLSLRRPQTVVFILSWLCLCLASLPDFLSPSLLASLLHPCPECSFTGHHVTRHQGRDGRTRWHPQHFLQPVRWLQRPTRGPFQQQERQHSSPFAWSEQGRRRPPFRLRL